MKEKLICIHWKNLNCEDFFGVHLVEMLMLEMYLDFVEVVLEDSMRIVFEDDKYLNLITKIIDK